MGRASTAWTDHHERQYDDERGPCLDAAAAAALYASTGDVSTQQDTTAHVQADLELSPRTFWFSTARWDRNLFTGFAYQESIASGGGFTHERRQA